MTTETADPIVASELSALDGFLLSRLHLGSSPPSALAKLLDPFFRERLGLSKAEWSEHVKSVVGELHTRTLIAADRTLTDHGRDALRTWLGIERLPSSRSRWPGFRNRYLLGLALEVDLDDDKLRKKIAEADRVRAIVLIDRFDLALGYGATLNQVKDALAWRQLQTAHRFDVLSGKKFTRDNVLAATGVDIDSEVGGKVDRLRENLIIGWLDRQAEWGFAENSAPEPTVTSKIPPTETPPEPFDLTRFAHEVKRVGMQLEDGRFGSNKVFLSHVYHVMANERTLFGTLTRAEFDGYLIEARKEGLLELSRADLVFAADQRDADESEIRLPYGTFHLLRLDR